MLCLPCSTIFLRQPSNQRPVLFRWSEIQCWGLKIEPSVSANHTDCTCNSLPMQDTGLKCKRVAQLQPFRSSIRDASQTDQLVSSESSSLLANTFVSLPQLNWERQPILHWILIQSYTFIFSTQINPSIPV